MKILIYRSTGEEIRKNSDFTNDLVTNLESYDIEIIMENNKSISLDKIREADLIIAFAHGDSDCIYHVLEETHDDCLIDIGNVEILENKRVIAFSCFTGSELGEMAIEAGCEAYLGFKSRIYRSLKDEEANQQFLQQYGVSPNEFISNIYKIAFYDSLFKGITEDYSFIQFQQYLSFMIKKVLMEQFRLTNNFVYQLQCQESVSKTADSIHINGSLTSKLMSSLQSSV